MFVCLTGVVWSRGDLGGRKAWIFIHKHGMFPSLQKKYHYTCPYYLSFHPWSLNLFFGVFWVLNRLFLEVPMILLKRPSCWKLLKQIVSAVSKRLFFSGVSQSSFFAAWFVLGKRWGWATELHGRDSSGYCSEEEAGNGFVHLITGVMKGKPPQVRGRYPSLKLTARTWKDGIPKRKRSSSTHQFSGAKTLVSRRVIFYASWEWRMKWKVVPVLHR